MTNKQLDILIGSLIGDGYLVFSGKRSKNAMYKLKQSAKKVSYVQYVYDNLGKYVSCKVRYAKSRKPSKKNGQIDHSIENWNGEYCESAYFWTKSHPEFTDLHYSWYGTGKKSIPKDIELNPRRLAHWFVEDGSNNVTKNSKGIFLYTNGFSECDVILLVGCLDRLGMEAKIYSGNVIRVMSGSYFSFMNMVKPYVKKFGCFDYKIDISKAPSDRKGEVWTGPKLTMEKANEIRKLRSDGKQLKEISKQYSVSIGTIGKIVNYQMYVPTLHFGGKAEVRLGFNFQH